MASTTAELSAEVPREEYEFFREQFPQYGASKWFITTALIEFNARIREQPSLKEHVDASIQQMLAMNRLVAADAPGEGE